MPALADTPLRLREQWNRDVESWQDELRWIFTNPGEADLGLESFSVRNFPEIAALLGATDDNYLRRAIGEHARDARPRDFKPVDARTERARRGAACAFFYLPEFAVSDDKYEAYEERARAKRHSVTDLSSVMARLSWARDVESEIMSTGSATVLPSFEPHRNKSRAAHPHRRKYAEAFIRLILQLADEDYGDDTVPYDEETRAQDLSLTRSAACATIDSAHAKAHSAESPQHENVSPQSDDSGPPASPGAFGSATPPTKDNGGLHRRFRKPVLWLALGILGVTMSSIAVPQVISGMGPIKLDASTPSVTVESVEGAPPTWGMNTVFWVPASAPLEELDGVVGGCDDPNARAWLWEHGSYRHPYQFTVRNVSDETVGISNVVAHGTTSPPQPGLLVTCSDGGQGGELEWSVVTLELADRAVAVLADDPVSPFFWRDIDAGEKAGVMVYPDGEQDFHGQLTVDASPVSAESSTFTVPDIDSDDALTIDWHGVPSDRSVVLTLMRDGYGERATCKANHTPMSSCTAVSLRSTIDDLWAGAPQ